jgi:protein-arginine kinase activator protein McsA
MNNQTTTKSSCNTCTRYLVDSAYQKSKIFYLFRWPLKFLIKMWVKIARIDIASYQIDHLACKNCNRAYKNALKDHSNLFNKLNSMINPIFDYYILKIVGADELVQAKSIAQDKSQIDHKQNDQKWHNT